LALQHLGRVALQEGECEPARALFDESLRNARDIGGKGAISHSLLCLGDAACAQGAYDEARGFYEEGLTILSEIGHKPDLAWALEGLAKVAVAAAAEAPNPMTAGSRPAEPQRQSETAAPGSGTARAARLFGAAEALRQGAGAPVPLA